MRDLFRFLARARDTLLFLALLGLSLWLLHSGNHHHRARAFSASNAVVATVHTWRKEVTDYASLKEVNRRLAEENALLRDRQARIAGADTGGFIPVVDSLRHQLFGHLPAKVVNSTWHKQRNFLTLDKGTLANVGADMGVVGPDGVVGVVREASPRFALVMSVLSPNLNISVRMRRTRHFGLLQWDGNRHGPLSAAVTDIAKHARVVEGDTVETRGGDGIFPQGVPVGIVTAVGNNPGKNYLDITIRLSEDMTRSAHVYVVKDLRRAERDSLEQDLLAP